MATNVLNSYPSEKSVSVSLPVEKSVPIVRFSIESFCGIAVAVLLVLGLGSGAYRKIQESRAVDAHRQGERDIADRNLEAALNDYTVAIQSNKKDYDALCRRAEVYAELGDRQRAENDVRQAIAIHPFWPFALDLQRQFNHYPGKGRAIPLSDSFDLRPVIN